MKTSKESLYYLWLILEAVQKNDIQVPDEMLSQLKNKKDKSKPGMR